MASWCCRAALMAPRWKAARRDLAAVSPSAGEYHTAPGAECGRVQAGGEPAAIIALPCPAAALRRVADHGTIAARTASPPAPPRRPRRGRRPVTRRLRSALPGGQPPGRAVGH